MLFRSEKIKKIEAYLQYFLPVILCLYPLRHIRVGVEWWDTGYNYANFTYMDRMDRMWFFSTYLGNTVGNFLQKLPFGDRMMGMNLYTGLFVSLLAVGGYFFFVKVIKLPHWIVFLGEFLAINLCWCPTALLYNYLTYVLMGVGYVLLYKALMSDEKQRRIYFVLAGVSLGMNVFVRFPNLAQMALIVAVWAMGIIRREKFGKIIVQTLWCIFGYILGIGLCFGWIAFRYGADTYIQAIIRLMSMPAEASDYTIVSMVVYQYRNYLQSLIWLSYFLGFLLVSLVVYKIFPAKIKWIAKIGFVFAVGLFFYFMRNRNMFNMKYSTKESAYQWAVFLLTATLIIGLAVIFSKRFTEQEKLLCGMNIIVILITPLGSNNHLYSSINNLFFVLPFTLWMLWRGLRALPKMITWRFSLELFPLKALCICMMVMIILQSTLFGWVYVFSEGNGGENLHTNIENSDILKGMLTASDRAEVISEIAAFVDDNDLKGNEVILYGQIPAMSYYLEMPFAISAWPDLASYNYEIMEQDLDVLEEQVALGQKELPVILTEIRQGSYLSGGREALESLNVSERDIDGIEEDNKLQLLSRFIEKYDYRITFENAKFVMFQANTERRETK